LAAWERLEQYDAVLATSADLRRKEDHSLHSADAFLAAKPAYVGTSWGKDSVAAAHICWRVIGQSMVLVWFSQGSNVNPDCLAVRDAFLARYPCDYREVDVSGYRADGAAGFHEVFSRAAHDAGLPRRYVSGVRADESSTRRERFRHWGESTPNTCAPIIRWGGEHVFAYAHKHSLPVHPAYACSLGGILDRVKIRVAAIGGGRGTGFGRLQWEWRYYPEVMRSLGIRRP
jgi:phosphoadenosine phosphosulfate reductase